MDGFDETYAKTKLKRKKKKQGTKPDWIVSLSTAQLSLAAAGIALLLVIMQLSPASFNSLRGEFNRIMQVDMSASQVFAAIRAFAAPQGLAETSQTEKQEEATEGATEEATEESASASGGEDIEVYEASSNVCFAPFDTTVEITVPVEGKITSRFGYRKHPITGKFGIHNGTDIAAEEGTPVSAAFNGTVEEVGYNDVRGNYILLSHGGDTKTLYMHCSEIIAEKGAVVRSGEIIAKVGNTGWSTGAHLHFSISVNGKYCNPEWLLNDL